MMAAAIQYVKIKPSGKLSLLLPRSMKYAFKNLLELFMNSNDDPKVDRSRVLKLISVALIGEVYMKNFANLSLVQNDVRITLTRSQALALWEMCQEHDQQAYIDAEMGNILMQLHQKLS